MKILNLTLYKEPFGLFCSGEKSREYRKPSEWIKSRLFDKYGNRKKIDVVNFKNGYGNVPSIIIEYKGFIISNRRFTKEYSTGFKVHVEPGDIIIKLGRIIENNFDNTLFY